MKRVKLIFENGYTAEYKKTVADILVNRGSAKLYKSTKVEEKKSVPETEKKEKKRGYN